MSFRFPLLSSLFLGSVLVPGIVSAQVSFQAHTLVPSGTGPLALSAHGDFNGDGREDLIYQVPSATPPSGTTKILLSSGDGTYDAAKTLPFQALQGTTAVGDFNHDGKLDLAVGGSSVTVYLGNGDGTFQAGKTVSGSAPGSGSQIEFLLATDLNHDNETDLVEAEQVQHATGADTTLLQVWQSNGDGTFKAGSATSVAVSSPTGGLAGDFDGDGNADVVVLSALEGTSYFYAYYGDGTGKLGSPYEGLDANGITDGFVLEPVDVNNDGRTDIVATRFNYGPSGTGTGAASVIAFIGNSNRTLTSKVISTSACPDTNVLAVADFNGDGINDLAFAEGGCSSTATGSQNFVIKPGTGGGAFGSEQTIFQTPAPSFGLVNPVKTSTGTKADLVFFEETTSNFNSGSPTPPPVALVLLSNESTGGFPTCGSPAAATGVQICSPGATASSPVTFAVGAAGPTFMRGANVWVDGKKVVEQLTHNFSNYSFLNASVALAAGSHSIAVYGTGIDESTVVKTFTLQVGSSGGACAAPASAGINICSPVNGSTPSSPVAVSAAGKVTGTFLRFEVWVDGVKKFTSTTADGANLSLPLAAGSHTFSFYAVNTAGTKLNKVSVVKVQ